MSSIEQEPGTSKLYWYASVVYQRLSDASELNEYNEQLFTGKYGKLFKESGASSTYYTPVRTLLLSPDLDPCITIEQRGTGSQPSIIRLHHPPPDEWKKILAEDLTQPREGATLGAELEGRVMALESWRESIGEVNLSEVLRNFEKRLKALEGER